MMQRATADRYLRLIAFFKLIQGLLLVAVAAGALHLVHKNVEDVAERIVYYLHFDAHNRHIAGLLGSLGVVDDRKLEELSGLTCLYAVVFLTEGVGLFFRKQWAKYFTVIATASLVPMEIYSLVQHFEWRKVVLLAVSIAIVWFLVIMLRRERPSTYYYRPTVLFK